MMAIIQKHLLDWGWTVWLKGRLDGQHKGDHGDGDHKWLRMMRKQYTILEQATSVLYSA